MTASRKPAAGRAARGRKPKGAGAPAIEAEGGEPASAREVLEPEIVDRDEDDGDLGAFPGGPGGASPAGEPIEGDALDAEAIDTESGELDLAEPAREGLDAGDDADLDASGEGLVPADPLQRYLTEIRRHPLLDAGEEHALAVRWKEEGDRAAAARLVTSNLRLVVMIARQYQRAFKNLLDLVQEGNVGLLEAVKNFDPYRGVRFPSYAVWWIRAYIIRYVMNNWRLVKLGTTQAQRKLFFNLQKEKDRLEREGFRPDSKLIADRLAVKQSEVVEMEKRLSGRDVSVDAPVGEDGDASMLDFLSDGRGDAEARFGDAEIRHRISEKIREFGQTLRDKEKVIFDRRMVAEDPLTLQEIGEEYGISRERVRQLEERIKKRLGEYLVREIPDLGDIDVRLSLGES